MEYQIDGSFSVEVTVPGSEPYSSVKNRASLTIGQVIMAETFDEARDMALGSLQKVTDDVKLHLAANAPGVDFYTDQHGVGQIGIGKAGDYFAEVDPPTAAPTAAAAPASPPAETAPASASNGAFVPKDHGKDRYTVQWDGVARTLFDNRASKTGNQPDLKLPKLEGEDQDKAFWCVNKDGSNNKAAYVLIKQIEEAVAV